VDDGFAVGVSVVRVSSRQVLSKRSGDAVSA